MTTPPVGPFGTQSVMRMLPWTFANAAMNSLPDVFEISMSAVVSVDTTATFAIVRTDDTTICEP